MESCIMLNEDVVGIEGKKDVKSYKLFQRAQKVMPTGNTRHTVFHKPFPIYAANAFGQNVVDVDGVSRIDFINNYSSLLHGHRHPLIMEAVKRQMDSLVSVGQPTAAEIELAELLCERVTGVDKVRFTNSGSEAVLMAIKAARAYTGRTKIAKFEGAYHGIYDSAEVSQAPTPDHWGDASCPNSVPLSSGSLQEFADQTIILPFNDVGAVKKILDKNHEDIAAIMVDPNPSHLRYLSVSDDMLQFLSHYTKAKKILLMFDEVYSLRLGYGGAQGERNIVPDITTMGKIIGGGFPIGAVGGSADVMSVFEIGNTRGFVAHGGTYNANPVSMTAGLVSMQLATKESFSELNRLGDLTREGLKSVISETGHVAQIFGLGSLISIVFGQGPFENYRDFYNKEADVSVREALHRGLLDRGILIAPYGLFVLSTVMVDGSIQELCSKASDVLRTIPVDYV